MNKKSQINLVWSIVFAVAVMSVLLVYPVRADTITQNNMAIREVDCITFQDSNNVVGLTQADICFGVKNLNTTDKQKINISAILHSTDGIYIVSQYEWANITHPTNTSSLVWVNNYTITNGNGTNATFQNYTTTWAYKENWYEDWKPAKMFALLNKTKDGRSDAINIGKNEEKFFKFIVAGRKASVGISSIKYDIKVDYSDGSKTAILDPWWNSTWTYKRLLNITDVSNNTLTSYAVPINVPKDAHLLGCDEVRFTNSSEDGELPYFLDTSNSTTCMFYINMSVSALGTTNIYMYYGNTTPVLTTSSGANTFLFFDGGESGTMTDVWSVTAGDGTYVYSTYPTPVQGSKVLNFTDGTGSFELYPIASPIGRNMIAESWIYYKSGFCDVGNSFEYYPRNTGTDEGGFGIICGITATKYMSFDGSTWTNTNVPISVGSWQKLGLVFLSNQTMLMYSNDTIITTRTEANNDNINRWFFVTDNPNPTATFVDNFRVRQYVFAEPSYSFGAEQGAGDTTKPLIDYGSGTTTSGNKSSNSITINVTASDANYANLTINVYNTTGTYASNFTEETNLTWIINNLPDGTYYFNATALDDSINSNSTPTREISIDTIKPNVVIIYPATNNTVSKLQSYNINYTVSDTHLSACWWTNNTGTNNYTAANCANLTTQTWAEGSNTVYIYANDTHGNVNSSSVTFIIDLTAPNTTIISPTNITYATTSILVNITATDAVNVSNIWYSKDPGATNTTYGAPINVVFSAGSNTLLVWANDSVGNLNATSVVFGVTLPVINSITWATSGGSTSSSLIYNQILSVITANITNVSSININASLTSPTGVVAFNNPMTPVGGFWNYTTSTILSEAGNWTITIYAGTTIDTRNISVSTLPVLLKDGFYGYGENKILNSSDMTLALDTNSYDLFELSGNASRIKTDWTAMLAAINKSSILNAKVGLNYVLDFNVTNSTWINDFKLNISANFPTLKDAPYYQTISYISLEISGMNGYTGAQMESALNAIAQNITAATSNKFVIYSKSYNSSSLTASYILGTSMNYIEVANEAAWIDKEVYLAENFTSLNRIYVNPTAAMEAKIQDYQTNVISKLRTPLKSTITYANQTAATTNGDVIVFNNGSTGVLRTINITSISTVGYDFWDSTNKLFVANDSAGVITVNISGYSATLVFSDQLDSIRMTGLTTGTLYKGTATSSQSFNYTDVNTTTSNYTFNGRSGNSGMYGAADYRVELYDPHYINNNLLVYYGWINSSYVNLTARQYDVMILADQNAPEISLLNCSAGKCYGYISVADYGNSQSWQDNKSAEVDTWIAKNASMNLFIDGLDYAVAGENFSVRFKELVDYVRVTKGKKAILNTYTAYQDYATWGDGVMKESCVERWNGTDPAAPNAYYRESWSLELNRSTWFQSHGVDVYCQAFGNRSISPVEILNYTDLQDVYFASKVLGYQYFYYSQPDFNYAWDEKVYDVGTDMANKYSTDDGETYYRRYSNGIVYYNTSTGHGWIDDGLTIDSVQVCFDLYDAHANSYNFAFNVNQFYQTPPGDGQYLISDTKMTLFGWTTVCQNITPSDNGRYIIEMFAKPRTIIVGQGFNIGYSNTAGTGINSWSDVTAGAYSWSYYPRGQNLNVVVIVNETKKASIDTFTTGIVETTTNSVRGRNLTVTSNSPYNIKVYSSVMTANTTKFLNISYYDTSKVRHVLDAINTANCDGINPTFATTNVNGEIFGACYEPSGNSTLWRVYAPTLSTRLFDYEVDESTPDIVFDAATYASGVYVNRTQSVYYSVTATDTHFANTTIYFYNITSPLISSIVNTSATATGYFPTATGDGLFFYNATAVDTSNNKNSTETRNFTLDTINPVIAFNYPTPTTNTHNTSLTINVTATDTNFANLTIYLYNITGLFASNLSTTANKVWKTNVIDGVYWYNVTVIDKASNHNSTETRNITVDATYPQISFTNYTETTGTTISTSIKINITASDTNLKNITIYLYNSSKNLFNLSSKTTSPFNWTFAAPDGLYFFNATAEDFAGNMNGTGTRNVTIATTTTPPASTALVGGGETQLVNVTKNETLLSVFAPLSEGLGGINLDNILGTLAYCVPLVSNGTTSTCMPTWLILGVSGIVMSTIVVGMRATRRKKVKQ